MIDEGDQIKSIKGFSDSWINKIIIKTSSKKTFEAGGEGGEQFKINMPKGKQPVAFCGGVSDHLDNLGCYFR